MPFYKQVLEQYDKLNVPEKGRGYFSVVATLVLLIVLLILIFPAVKHITKVSREVSDARKVKAALENKIIDLEEARKSLDAVSSTRPLLDAALPVGADLGNYLKKIEELASSHSLGISTIQFDNIPLEKPKQEGPSKVRNLPYSLTLEGDFPNFQKFLIDIENYIRTSNVSGINIAKETTKASSGTVVGETIKEALEITSYYFGVETTPTAKGSSGTTTQQSGGNQ